MKPRGPRLPFDHIKDIYGNKLEHYSYQKIERDPDLSKKAFKSNNAKRNNYEFIREKILEYGMLLFALFMLGVGVYFILTSVASA